MQLHHVLHGVPLRGDVSPGVLSVDVKGLAYDSRMVGEAFLFFAFPGAKTDGREYAQQALDRGAAAVVSEPATGTTEPAAIANVPRASDRARANPLAPAGVTSEPCGLAIGPAYTPASRWILVEHGRRALALACRNFFGPPEIGLLLTAVTGTNGKTTITYLIDAVMRKAGNVTGVFGTIGNQLAGDRMKSVNTTPESLDLYKLFELLRARGGTHVAMEVSSHALALGRVYALAFHTVVFTNLTQDHMDFHRSMEEYFESKHLLFVPNGAAAPLYAVINADDEYGRRIRPAPETKVLTYGLHDGACVRAEDIETGFEGLSFTLRYEAQRVTVRSPLVGDINVYNILAACAAGISYGLELEVIADGIAGCTAVPGRFERVDEGQPFLVVVDYAHTPDALRNAIGVARSLKPKRVITVFGCGGDRDRSKRPLMGMAAGELSDYVVLTSDNPRSEDPLNIINDALVGLRRNDTPHQVEADRTRAIRLAVEEARPGDLILLAGKGHETYQVLRDQTIDFDDREAARKVLKEFGYRRKVG